MRTAAVPAEPLKVAERTGRVGFGNSALYKTDAFLEAHPFGTVSAAFSPDDSIGIFESNSIMCAVARLGQDRFSLCGRNAYEASRIDGFLDASLIFARDAQHYLLALRGSVTPEVHARARESFETYLSCIEQALHPPAAFPDRRGFDARRHLLFRRAQFVPQRAWVSHRSRSRCPTASVG